MKFTQCLIPTLREAPADAEVVSHKLLVRAGMIRRVAAGIYEFLPLGLRSLKKVAAIIQQEMDRTGCQEVLLPHLIPAELWQESGRWQKYGKELLRLQDRHERNYCFGPTHEEVICDLVRFSVTSYKSYPFHLYQIQTKFRDETRPRFGLMRGREFLMKDGYSFHTSFDDLDREYKKMHEVYLKIFERCGLECRAVEADTGAIGGSSSHEFMVLAGSGEDAIATCAGCSYAANLEMATFFVKLESAPSEKIKEVHTPHMKKIAEVSNFLGTKEIQMIKTLVYRAGDEFVIVCLAGDRTVNEVALKRVTGADDITLATDQEVFELTGVVTGFLGPVRLNDIIRKKNPQAKFKIVFDRSVSQCGDGVTGANKEDYHIQHVDVQRDLGLRADDDRMACFSTVVENDLCPQCQQGRLRLNRGIEVGHIFKLGTRYSQPMKVHYLDRDGVEKPAVMGTYGIGVGRTLAASVEQNHDEQGIIWPAALAPYGVELLNLDTDSDILEATHKLYDHLRAAFVEVLWDDRDERAGVKFNDADLIGCPLQVIAGKRSLKKGVFEFKVRKTGERGEVKKERAAEEIKRILERLSLNPHSCSL